MKKKIQKKRYELGEIRLGESVYVSDPCYSIGTWCQALLVGVVPGYYTAFVNKAETDWFERISDLWVVLDEEILDNGAKFPTEYIESADIGVDSGMCGIFDESYYKHFHTSEGVDDDWYEMVCDKTSNVNVGSTMDGVCAFSATGFGDGGYDLYIKRNDEGKIVAIGVQYLDDDYEWDEEYEIRPEKIERDR